MVTYFFSDTKFRQANCSRLRCERFGARTRCAFLCLVSMAQGKTFRALELLFRILVLCGICWLVCLFVCLFVCWFGLSGGRWVCLCAHEISTAKQRFSINCAAARLSRQFRRLVSTVGCAQILLVNVSRFSNTPAPLRRAPLDTILQSRRWRTTTSSSRCGTSAAKRRSGPTGEAQQCSCTLSAVVVWRWHPAESAPHRSALAVPTLRPFFRPKFGSTAARVPARRRCYYKNTDAIIYVVDSADTERLAVAKEELLAMLQVCGFFANNFEFCFLFFYLFYFCFFKKIVNIIWFFIYLFFKKKQYSFIFYLFYLFIFFFEKN